MTEKDILIEELREIEFNPREALIYITLLETGETTAGILSEKTKIHRTKIYEILRNMLRKGYIKEIPSVKKHFIAVKPETLLKNKEFEVEERFVKESTALKRLSKRLSEFSALREKAEIDYEFFEVIREPTVSKNHLLRILKKAESYFHLLIPSNEESDLQHFQKIFLKANHNFPETVIIHPDFLTEEFLMEIKRRKYRNKINFRISSAIINGIKIIDGKQGFMDIFDSKDKQCYACYVIFSKDIIRLLEKEFQYAFENSISLKEFLEAKEG